MFRKPDDPFQFWTVIGAFFGPPVFMILVALVASL
jgi:hypothetical protein